MTSTDFLDWFEMNFPAGCRLMRPRDAAEQIFDKAVNPERTSTKEREDLLHAKIAARDRKITELTNLIDAIENRVSLNHDALILAIKEVRQKGPLA